MTLATEELITYEEAAQYCIRLYKYDLAQVYATLAACERYAGQPIISFTALQQHLGI